MHAWILNRYLITEVFPPLSMGLLVVSFTLLIILIIDAIDEIFLAGAPFGPLFKLLAFAFPTLLTMALPIGSLLATMLVYGRLVEDRELTAMRAAGMSGFSLMFPALALGCFLTALNYYWTAYVIPKSMANLNQASSELLEKMTSINFFKPGQFNTPQDDLALYFSDMRPGTNTLERVMIFKSGAEGGMNWFGEGDANAEASDWTVWAPTATLNPLPSEGVLQLILSGCIAENLGNPGKISRVHVESATISIDVRRKLSKMSASSLTRDSESMTSYLKKARGQMDLYYIYMARLLAPPNLPRNDPAALLAFEIEMKERETQNPTSHKEILDRAKELAERERAEPGYLEREHGFINLRELDYMKNVVLGAQLDINRAMKRIAYPVGTFLFVLIGAPLGILMGRGKKSICLIATTGILLAYYSLEKVAETVSEELALTSHWDPGWFVWTPNLLLLAFGLVLVRVVSRY
jgi:lipopolysaccharide export LptBFGC system permease protein LptF